VEVSKRKCRVRFWVGEHDYWGTVTIYYLFEGGRVVWNDRYRIREASNRCLYYAAHPSSCPTKVYHR
jgi:hypothetical protein